MCADAFWHGQFLSGYGDFVSGFFEISERFCVDQLVSRLFFVLCSESDFAPRVRGQARTDSGSMYESFGDDAGCSTDGDWVATSGKILQPLRWQHGKRSAVQLPTLDCDHAVAFE